MQGFRRALAALLAAALLPLAATLALNAVVDPYGMTLWFSLRGVNAEMPSLEYQSRITKSLGLQRFRTDTVLLGSSVIDEGFLVRGSTAYDTDRVAYAAAAHAHSTVPVFNAAVRVGGIYEAGALLRYAHRTQPGLKRALLGIEWGIFTTLKGDEGALDSVAFLNEPAGASFKYLTQVGAEDTARTLLHNISDSGVAAALARPIRQALAARLAPISLHSDQAVIGRTPAETRALYFGLYTASQCHRHLQAYGDDAMVRADALEHLREVAAYARDHDIQLTVFINPHPAVYWETFAHQGLWEANQVWLRRVAEITPYYDFSALMDFGPNQDAHFPGDPIHYAPLVGETLLPLLLDPDRARAAGADYVTAATVDAALARRTDRLEAWRAANPYYQDVLDALSPEFDEFGSDLGEVLPEIVGEPQGADAIVRVANQYFSAPAAQGPPFDLLRLVSGGYANAVRARTEAEVRAALQLPPAARAALVPGGRPLASPGSLALAQCFDGDATTFCMSAERGGAVQGGAWLGYKFDRPFAVRAIHLLQNNNARYRQNAVWIEYSRNGRDWIAAQPLPAPSLIGTESLAIADAPAAMFWRVRAAADNAQPYPDAVWAPFELSFAD
jgi:hypothetical protein